MATELKKLTALLSGDLAAAADGAQKTIADARPRVLALRDKALQPMPIYGPATVEKIRLLTLTWNSLREAYGLTGSTEPVAWAAVGGGAVVQTAAVQGTTTRGVAASSTTSAINSATATTNNRPQATSTSESSPVKIESSPKRMKIEPPSELLVGGGTRRPGPPAPAAHEQPEGVVVPMEVDAGDRKVAQHIITQQDQVVVGDNATRGSAATSSSSSSASFVPSSRGGGRGPQTSASSSFRPAEEQPPPVTTPREVFDLVHRASLQTGLMRAPPETLETSESLTRIKYEARRGTFELMFLTSGNTALVFCQGQQLLKVDVAAGQSQVGNNRTQSCNNSVETVKKLVHDSVIYPYFYGLVVPKFENLPAEIVDTVLAFLDVKSLGRVEKASKLVYTQCSVALHMQNFVWRNVFDQFDRYLSGPETCKYALYAANLSETAVNELRTQARLSDPASSSFCSSDQDVPPKEWKSACERAAKTLAGRAETERKLVERTRSHFEEMERNRVQWPPPPRGGWWPGKGGGKGQGPIVPPGIWYDPVNPFDPGPARGGAFNPAPAFRDPDAERDLFGVPDPLAGDDPYGRNPLADPRPPPNVPYPRNPDAERDLFGVVPPRGPGNNPLRIDPRPNPYNPGIGDPDLNNPLFGGDDLDPMGGNGRGGGKGKGLKGPRLDPLDPFGDPFGRRGKGGKGGGFGGFGGGGFGGFGGGGTFG
ncbi:unnamed protein product [Amoebophrya sp. A120]|nr:unnamed protein product [Amoebophrya sp. A120]|eukprot:GSA120T00011274001.1